MMTKAVDDVYSDLLGVDLPMMPLNTDGLDFNGHNATIRRVKITNWDDAIVAKPSRKGNRFDCTQDLYA